MLTYWPYAGHIVVTCCSVWSHVGHIKGTWWSQVRISVETSRCGEGVLLLLPVFHDPLGGLRIRHGDPLLLHLVDGVLRIERDCAVWKIVLQEVVVRCLRGVIRSYVCRPGH